VFRFGPFTVNFTTGEVHKGGVRLRVPDQAVRILQMLLKQPGELVTREDLRDHLWAADEFVDFERSLNAAVAKLRQALGDSADQPLYVETVARKGYRFIAPVTAEAAKPRTPPVPVAEAEPAITKRLTLPLGLIAGLALAGLAFVAFTWRMARTGEDRPLLQLGFDVGDLVSQPAISPDAIHVVFHTKTGLGIRRLDETTITHLAGTEGASYPFFSPNGRWVGYFAGRKLMKIPREGGAPVTLCEAPLGGGASWGEDDQIIASLNSSGGLWRIPAAGGPPQPFTDVKGDVEGATNHRVPHVLPGGKGTLFVASNGVAFGSLRFLPPNGGPARTLVDGSSGGRYLPGGYLVYSKGANLLAAPMDLGRGELTGAPSPLVEGVARDHLRGTDFDVSPSGILVYRKGATRAKRDLVWLDVIGGKESLGLKPDGFVTPRLSPDGKRVALMIESEGQAHLWTYDLTHRTMTRLTFDNQPRCCPVWTPDGKFLVFSSGGQLTVVLSDGSGKEERLPQFGRSTVPWSISRDGKWLAFHQNSPETGSDAWVAPLEEASGKLRAGQEKALVRRPGLQAAPTISPDGRWMAHTSDESGQVELYVVPFSPQGPVRSGRWQVSNEKMVTPLWCRECQAIFYRGGEDRRIRAVRYAVKGDSFVPEMPRNWSGQQLADVGIYPSFDVTADGKRALAVVETKEPRSDETHLRVTLNVTDELRRRFAVR
jgi:DNA-binding winged helix-turn-helix (wHTH) protein